ncbi:hypothetical protein BH10PSE17_BH10PSE17_37590 [soil metagenome]
MNSIRRQILIASASCAIAAPLGAADRFLDPQVAFRFSTRRIDARTVELRWAIAPGYYMYRKWFKFAVEGAEIAAPVLPPAERKFDENFGEELEIYKVEVVVPLVLTSVPAGAFTIKAVGQGCAEGGLCYPPQNFTARIDAVRT